MDTSSSVCASRCAEAYCTVSHISLPGCGSAIPPRGVQETIPIPAPAQGSNAEQKAKKASSETLAPTMGAQQAVPVAELTLQEILEEDLLPLSQ